MTNSHKDRVVSKRHGVSGYMYIEDVDTPSGENDIRSLTKGEDENSVIMHNVHSMHKCIEILKENIDGLFWAYQFKFGVDAGCKADVKFHCYLDRAENKIRILIRISNMKDYIPFLKQFDTDNIEVLGDAVITIDTSDEKKNDDVIVGIGLSIRNVHDYNEAVEYHEELNYDTKLISDDKFRKNVKFNFYTKIWNYI